MTLATTDTKPLHSTRPWPTAKEIDAAQADDGSPDGFNREWSCFDFSTCQHNSSAIIACGPWEVEICNDCGNARTECVHETCEWNEEGTLLRCVTCGIDGT